MLMITTESLNRSFDALLRLQAFFVCISITFDLCKNMTFIYDLSIFIQNEKATILFG